MSKKEALQELIDRYDCEVHDVAGDVHIYYKNIFASLCFWEDIQKWVYSNLRISNKTEWTTGYSGRITTPELIAVLDRYLPRKTEEQLSLL